MAKTVASTRAKMPHRHIKGSLMGVMSQYGAIDTPASFIMVDGKGLRYTDRRCADCGRFRWADATSQQLLTNRPYINYCCFQ